MLLPLLPRSQPVAMAAAPALCAAARYLTTIVAPGRVARLGSAPSAAAEHVPVAAAAAGTTPTPTPSRPPRRTLPTTPPLLPAARARGSSSPPLFSPRAMATMTTTTTTTQTTTAAKTTTATTKAPKPAAELLAEAHALAAQPPAAALPALRALAPDLAAAAPSLSPSQLAVLLPALARAGLSDRAFRDAACAALVSRLDELSPAELADAAFALARGLGHDHELLTHVVERAAKDPAAFGTSSLSKILWACARLSYAHDALPDLLEHVVGACSGAPESAQAIAEISFAAGSLDWADDRLHNAVAAYAAANARAFDGHGLAKLLSGLVGVGYDDAALFEMLAERAAEHAASGRLAPSDAARIAWALGEGGVWSVPMMHSLSSHMLEPPGRLDAFTPAELQTIVRACNKLNYCSPGVAAAASRLTDRLLPHLEPLAADDDGHAPGVSFERHWNPMSSPPPPPQQHHPHHNGGGGGGHAA